MGIVDVFTILSSQRPVFLLLLLLQRGPLKPNDRIRKASDADGSLLQMKNTEHQRWSDEEVMKRSRGQATQAAMSFYRLRYVGGFITSRCVITRAMLAEVVDHQNSWWSRITHDFD